MLSNHLVFSIMKLRLRRLERPTELPIRGSLAGIDLRSRRVRVQDDFFAGGSLDRIRHIRRNLFQRGIFRLGIREKGSEYEDAHSDDRSRSREKSSHEGDCSRQRFSPAHGFSQWVELYCLGSNVAASSFALFCISEYSSLNTFLSST